MYLKLLRKREVLGWALYDWANSAFATTVMAGFFPIFFKDYWCKGREPTVSTFWLGITVSASSLIVAVLAPLLGAMADRSGSKKRSLLRFAALGILATGGLYFVPEGRWQVAALLYGLGMIGFLCSLVFYDSLIVSVSEDRTVDRVSSLGYGVGYLGGGVLFLLNVLMVRKPALFGLSSPAAAVQLAFVTVAVWWAVFAIPLFFLVPEPAGGRRMSLLQGAREGFGQVIRTVREIRRQRSVLLFLLAYWFYIDGVDTVITMAVDYGRSIGFGTGELVTALLLVQFVGFPFACLMGFIASRWSTKGTILLCLAAYIGVTLVGSQIDLQPYRLFGLRISKFYTITFMIAVVQGGTQALSRAFYSRLIPKANAAQFFGFYNMLGKFAAIMGPVLMGVVARATGSPRAGMRAVTVLFVIGAALLALVKTAPPEAAEPVGAGS
jgi:UMF1 family MFS transporter